MSKRLVGLMLVALALLFSACSMETAPEASLEPQITFGTPDNGAHPYVGTLLFIQNGVGYYSCTGTLLSPTVMLTAGHCVEEAGNVNDVTYVRFAENALEGIENYASTGAWLAAEWIEASSVVAHPRYEGTYFNTYDVGLVFLSEPVHLSRYGVLPELGFLETLLKGKNHRNRTFTAVGYGLQGILNPFYGDDFSRRQAQTSLIELRSTFNGDDNSAKFTNNPGKGNGKGGTCFGDSGGPLFYGDTNIIGAIVSWGITPCIGVDFQFRIDTVAAQDFILEHLNE